MKQMILFFCALILCSGGCFLYMSEAMYSSPVFIGFSSLFFVVVGMLCVAEVIVIEILKRDSHV